LLFLGGAILIHKGDTNDTWNSRTADTSSRHDNYVCNGKVRQKQQGTPHSLNL
jgi:hypothetical protein